MDAEKIVDETLDHESEEFGDEFHRHEVPYWRQMAIEDALLSLTIFGVGFCFFYAEYFGVSILFGLIGSLSLYRLVVSLSEYVDAKRSRGEG